MSKPASVTLDTKDDRREMAALLARLHPLRRVAFLRWCCARATVPHSRIRPVVAMSTEALAREACRDDAAGERLTFDIYISLWQMSMDYNFDLGAAALELERRGRRHGRALR